MKKHLTRFMATALSVAMVAANPLTVLADPVAPGTNDTNANILAYKVESVVVPTNIQVALNPQGYDVAVRNFADPDEADITDAQIISLNYGIVNKSTSPKTVTVSVAVEWENENVIDGDIVFVNREDINDFPAKEICLELKGNIGNVTDINEDVFTEEMADDAMREALGDVLFTSDADHPAFDGDTRVFGYVPVYDAEGNPEEDEEGNPVMAVVGEKSFENLDAAHYEADPTFDLTIETTQEDLNNNMVIDQLGGVAGFTITGAMNELQDWTVAGVGIDSIRLIPTYEFADYVEPNAEENVEVVYENSVYTMILPAEVVDINVADVVDFKVNDYLVDFDFYSDENITEISVTRQNVVTAMGSADFWAADELIFTFTIGHTNYTGVIERD